MIYKMNVSGRGMFLLPHRNGRTTFLNNQSLTTNGRGLLETRGDHSAGKHVMTSGCGVEPLVKMSRSVASAPAPNLQGLKARLASVNIGGRGVKPGAKKKYISLKL